MSVIVLVRGTQDGYLTQKKEEGSCTFNILLEGPRNFSSLLLILPFQIFGCEFSEVLAQISGLEEGKEKRTIRRLYSKEFGFSIRSEYPGNIQGTLS